MITSIKINNFKSIERMIFNVKYSNILCLLGKNGAGKSTVFKAIRFFFDNIENKYSSDIGVDTINPYIQKCSISITFNIHLLRIKAQNNSKLNSEFENITKYLSDDFSNIDEIELTLTQYKDGTISWNIDNVEIRRTIRNAFQLYYIDTRYLDLFSWDKLWKIINDLSISAPHTNEDKYIDILDDAFSEIYGQKYLDSKDIIKSVFEQNNISMDKYNFDNRLSNAFSMRFGGNHFLVNERHLEFYSDGTNSFKYLLLLISLIPQISVTSCKFPIIIVDEPEIGLHNAFISEYVSRICKNIEKNALLLMSTHSPKIISELANSDEKYELYKIDNYRLHSIAKKLNLSWIENKAIVTVKETECYFCDYLAYVEGESELQLFKNKNIISLFPQLSKIHFYSFDGNDSRLRNAYSNTLNLGIDYRLVVDSDKIISFKNKFKLGNDKLLNPLKNEKICNLESYRYYNDESSNVKKLREEIIQLIKRKYKKINNGCCLENYELIISKVKEYCMAYNVIVNNTTIEGELITFENIDKFLLYIQTRELNKNQKRQHDNIISIADNIEKTYKVICECNGKSELQFFFSSPEFIA